LAIGQGNGIFGIIKYNQSVKRSVSIYVQGKVQGVGFRYSSKARADSLNITGYVQNMFDGSVYIEASGMESNLHQFIQWCRQGPALAQVRDLRIEESEDASGVPDEGFVIR